MANIIQLCQRTGKRGHARATTWADVEWIGGYDNTPHRKVYAYCDACVADDPRVAGTLGAVEVTPKGEAERKWSRESGLYCVEEDCLANVPRSERALFMADGLCADCRAEGKAGIR